MLVSSKEGRVLCMIGPSHKTEPWRVQNHTLYFRKEETHYVQLFFGIIDQEHSFIVKLEYCCQWEFLFLSSLLYYSKIICYRFKTSSKMCYLYIFCLLNQYGLGSRKPRVQVPTLQFWVEIDLPETFLVLRRGLE